MTRSEKPYLRVKGVENEILTLSDIKMYEELNETSCSSIGAKFTELWPLKVEKRRKQLFEKQASKFFIPFFSILTTM